MGDPTCPVTLRKAKQLCEEIKSGMDFSDAEGVLVVDVNVAPNVYDEKVAEAAAAAPDEAAPPTAAATVSDNFLSDAPSVIGQ